MTLLQQELRQLDSRLLERLRTRGFVEQRFVDWAEQLRSGCNGNQLEGRVEVAPDDRMRSFDAENLEASRLGKDAIAKGQLAVCVLAGGMATRMGGVVKALLDIQAGTSFLDFRLAELARWHNPPPLWLMTSEATHGPIGTYLDAHPSAAVRQRTRAFEQEVALRLTTNANLFRDANGQPSVYATGHGDLPEALLRSGLLSEFNRNGGRYVWISNIDNLGASVDPTLLGHHIQSGKPLTVELVDKQPGDTGGGPVVHNGRCVIAEQFRLPKDFDASAVPVFNTNTFIVSSEALATLELDWTYLEVRKEVDGRIAVQFERLIGELSYALDTQMLRVPREGQHNRFLPVKHPDDLTRLAPEIERMCRQRECEPNSGTHTSLPRQPRP